MTIALGVAIYIAGFVSPIAILLVALMLQTRLFKRGPI